MIWLLVALFLFSPTVDFGQVISENGDGVVLNLEGTPVDPYYNYIKYDENAFCKGDYIFTLYLYNPQFAYLGKANV